MMIVVLFLVFVAVCVAFYYSFEPVRLALQRSVFRQRQHVTNELAQMFIFISAQGLQTLKWSLALSMAGIFIVLAWDATPPFPFIVGGVVGVVSYWGPEIFIIFLRRRRRAAFSEQLVDGLVMMANGLRSGFNFPQAIDMLIEEMPPPISQEFRLMREEIRMGVDLDQALKNCVERTKDEDLDLVVSAIQITRQLGGNLAEVFDRIVAMVRDRKILAGKADALTSEGKLQALVVGVLPYGFMFMMVKINPEMMRLLWTTVPGCIALGTVIALDIIGYLWVRKVANVEY